MALGPLRHTALHIMGVIEVARVRHTALARSLTASFFRIDFARALQWLARSTGVFVEFRSSRDSAWERTPPKLRFDALDMLWKQSFRKVPSQAEPGTECK